MASPKKILSIMKCIILILFLIIQLYVSKKTAWDWQKAIDKENEIRLLSYKETYNYVLFAMFINNTVCKSKNINLQMSDHLIVETLIRIC